MDVILRSSLLRPISIVVMEGPFLAFSELSLDLMLTIMSSINYHCHFPRDYILNFNTLEKFDLHVFGSLVCSRAIALLTGSVGERVP